MIDKKEGIAINTINKIHYLDSSEFVYILNGMLTPYIKLLLAVRFKL